MINPEFNIPHYIVEDLVLYIEETAKGKCKTTLWENILVLLNQAKLNNRLTENQVETLINLYCREK